MNPTLKSVFASAVFLVICPGARAEDLPLFPNKPKAEALLKEKSLKRAREDFDVIVNSSWEGEADKEGFEFVDAMLIRVPLRMARPEFSNFAIYPKMTDAIKKFSYDPKTQIFEVMGEKGGLSLHSWIHVDQKYHDRLEYDIVRGDLRGFKVQAYLFDMDGKTLAVAKGVLPGARERFPKLVALLLKPVSEIVLGIASKNFRSYIEEEYKNKKEAALKK